MVIAVLHKRYNLAKEREEVLRVFIDNTLARLKKDSDAYDIDVDTSKIKDLVISTERVPDEEAL